MIFEKLKFVLNHPNFGIAGRDKPYTELVFNLTGIWKLSNKNFDYFYKLFTDIYLTEAICKLQVEHNGWINPMCKDIIQNLKIFDTREICVPNKIAKKMIFLSEDYIIGVEKCKKTGT